ncbi:amidase [Ferrovibrio sp.]|uniref:amidase n=1 Tax=Ferrovibrio sp. TaxID=1917215 RepID=UPI000CAE9520|nr:amidase [Ferrovibrio sp.]PJI40945.1 MAG: amidase [Ferrovibrio sp.]
MTADLIRLSARRVHDLLARREISPADLVEASIARMEKVDGTVNAVPTRCFDRAREQAKDPQIPHSKLGGIPFVIKDNAAVGNVRWTGGTPIFADRIAPESDRTIALIERNGGIPLGKANLSELGGANTTNAALGTTRNPWNTALTCGGSSGGSAVALATGQVWLAHGNDVGGSLRIPASFCGVTGLRPTPGRVPRRSILNPFDTIFVDGPMARDVGDLALFFDAMVGFDSADPLSAPSPDAPFLSMALTPDRPLRAAWSADLGCLPVDDQVRALGDAFVAALQKDGMDIDNACPDFAGALPALLTLRGANYVTTWEPFLERHRHQFTPEVMGDIEHGLRQTPASIGAAERYRAEMYRRVIAFLGEYEVLITPSTPILPFAVETMWPQEIAGVRQRTYIDWIAITAITSLLACPVLAIPAGFSRDGLPFGVQIIGRPRSEGRLFQIAAAIEHLLGLPPAIIEPKSTANTGK